MRTIIAFKDTLQDTRDERAAGKLDIHNSFHVKLAGLSSRLARDSRGLFESIDVDEPCPVTDTSG